MGLNDNESRLSMPERRKKGLLWVDIGENMNQQIYARGLCQDFNQTRAAGSSGQTGSTYGISVSANRIIMPMHKR